MPTHSREEIQATYDRYVRTRERAQRGEVGWDTLAEFFTDDATFIDPAWGRVDGIEAIRKFLAESMAGLDGWTFPREWTVIDGDRLVTGWLNRLPGEREGGGYWEAPGVSVMVYAGDGKFSYEEDFLNMVHVFEVMKSSGWRPTGPMHAPPKEPLRR